LAASSLDALVNSELIANLNPEPKTSLPGGIDSNWIIPGRSLWSWWSDPNSPGDFSKQQEFVLYADQLEFEYVLVDAGWESGFPQGNADQFARLTELCAFARQDGRKVGIWVWKNWVEIIDPNVRADFFFKVKASGAVGVKIDFMNSEATEVLAFYKESLKQAGRLQLMVNFHGANKSTGEYRTFPHEMTREAVRGLEYNIAPQAQSDARHNAIIPFARFVVGPADYTPVTFDETRLHGTTFTHQLATAGLFTSPLTHWADHPQRYIAQTDALDVIKGIPSTWDETRVLSISEIGTLAAMARRKNDQWFVFILNGDENNPKTLPALSLDFLGPDNYDAVFLGDQTPNAFARFTMAGVTASDSVPVNMLPGGGFVAMLTKQPVEITTDLDSDGDEVADILDCAPNDPSISSPHTFYTDLDRDHFGDPNKPVTVCSPIPNPPLVAWGNDPIDFLPDSYPQIAPKGNRLLGIDSHQTPDSGVWTPTLLNELGAEVTPLRLSWGRFESAAGTFNGPDAESLRIAMRIYPPADLKIALVVSAFKNGQPSFPADLQAQVENGTLSPNDPLVIKRFSAWLDVIGTMIPASSLHSLQIDERLDAIYVTRPDPGFWSGRINYFLELKTHAEGIWGEDLPVFSTASYSSLSSAPTAAPFYNLMSLGDVVGIHFQPFFQDFRIVEPEDLQSLLEPLFANYYGRDIFLIDVAYPSLPSVYSSETKQSQSLRSLFELWDRHADSIPYISLLSLYDPPTTADSSKSNRYFSSLGLRTHNDKPKAAYKTLRNLTYERGWWRIPESRTRSFRMGFSQTAYDLAETIQEREEVLSWMIPNLTANSDITSIQIDMGVPWVEALADDLSSPTPPYHPFVLQEFEALENSVRPGGPRVVAISPIGVPRSQISAYLGEGPGFNFVSGGFSGPEFVRTPDGQVRISRLRYPPPPWDSYPLNATEVKNAYLKYCIRILDYFKPDYLLTCLESSAALVEDPQRYAELVDLMKFIYENLKSHPQYRDIPQVISISTTSFMKDEYGIAYKLDEQMSDVFDRQIEGLRQILPYMDVIGLSNYPHFGKYNAYTISASMYDSLFESIALAGGAEKPIAISENGYGAETFYILNQPFLCTPQKQDDYLKNLLYSLEKTDHKVEYIVNWAIRDNDYLWQREHTAALQSGDPTALLFSQFNQYFRDIGLFDGNGNDERPALARWRSTLGKPLVPKELLARYPGYMDWALSAFPGVAAFPDLATSRAWGLHADPDSDGRLNIFEYLQLSDPYSPDSESPLRIHGNGDEKHIELPLNLNASDIPIELQYSPDLASEWLAVPNEYEVIDGPDEHGRAFLRVPIPGDLNGRGFFRLEASPP
jgi:hypothetical protein